MKDLIISELNDIYGGLLTQRQTDAIRQYYDYDLSYAEIAEVFGITRQAISQVIETSVKQLETLENKLGLLSIFRELNSLRALLNEQEAIEQLDKIIALIGAKANSKQDKYLEA